MNRKKFGVLIPLVLIFSNVLAQTGFPNPDSLLSEANSALSNLESISYHAEHYAIGILNVRGEKMTLATTAGDVALARLSEDSAFGAKLFINGQIVNANPNRNNREFTFLYDGDKIFKIPFQEKVVYVNEPDQTGKLLFVEAQNLVFQGFIRPEYVRKAVNKADSVSYAGHAVVDATPCNIVYTQTQNDSYLKETWWFLGNADFLPRKVLHRYSGTDGRDRMEVAQFTNLEKNNTSDDAFTINTPQDHTVSRFKGFSKLSSLLSNGERAPDWTLKNIEGKTYSLDFFRGKVTILDFWATWCGPCREEMQNLQKIHEKYSDNTVAVLGINTWENGDPNKFMTENGITYRLLVEGDEVAQKYNVNGLPTLYIINQEGEIIYSKFGVSENGYQEIVDAIERAL